MLRPETMRSHHLIAVKAENPEPATLCPCLKLLILNAPNVVHRSPQTFHATFVHRTAESSTRATTCNP